MRKKVKQHLMLFLVPMLLCVVMIGSAVANVNASLFEQMPSSFSPVSVGSASFTVYDMTYKELGKIDLGPDGQRYYVDPTHTYPNIDVFYTTNVYNSDRLGNYVGDNVSWLSTSLVIGDNVYTLHEGYVSFGFGARTLSNLPAWRTDTTQALDPLAGFTIAHSGGTMTLVPTSGTVHDQYIPHGLLLFTVDTGLGPWQVGSMAGAARITQSLEKIDFNAAMHGTPLAAGYMNFAGAKNRLATAYGNSPVIVRPKFTLIAKSDFLRYDCNETTTLDDGTVVTTTVETTSNMVGFESAWEDVPLRESVLIPKATDDQFERTNFEPVDPEVSKPNVAQNDNSNPPVTISTYKGGVKYLYDSSPAGGELLGQKMGIANAYTSLYGTAPSIDLNQVAQGALSLPSTLTTYNDFTLQPSTRVKTATTQVYGGVHHYDGLWPDNYDEFSAFDYKIEYPYAFNLTNVATYCVVTARVAMVTANKITVTSEGIPFDIDALIDYDLGDLINNPTVDDIVVENTNTQINWWEIFENLFTGITGIIMWIAIGCGAVAVIYVVAQFKKKG